MQDVTLNLMTAEEFFHSHVTPQMAKRTYATLSADPWTLDDIKVSLGRFLEKYPNGMQDLKWLPGLSKVAENEPALWMDLVSQQVAAQSLPWRLDYRGSVPFRSSYLREFEFREVVQVPFHLADSWCLTADGRDFRDYALSKRDFVDREHVWKARKFLYSGFPEFVFPRILCEIRRLRNILDDDCEGVMQRIHAEWFSRQFEALGNVCFRDWIRNTRNHHIVEDLANQTLRWSMIRRPPPAIPRNSHAYRNSGFGLHEATLFFSFQRAILHEGISRAFQTVHGTLDLDLEIDHLQQFGQDWLHCPDEERLHGQTPASVIDNERRRLPEVLIDDATASERDRPIDPRFPELDSPEGPTFVHLVLDDEMRNPPFGVRLGNPDDVRMA